MSETLFDVAVVGGGPAGAVCAAVCAEQGLRTVVLERAKFPREKVCGDCLNPSAWPVLERLQLAGRVRELAHAELRRIEFVDGRGRTFSHGLESAKRTLVAIRRSLLDDLLLHRAAELGAEVQQQTTVQQCRRDLEGWEMETENRVFRARQLVAADGRNSTVARLLGLLPKPHPDRIGQQTHLACPPDLAGSVRMQFLPHGYCGLADVGDGLANLCLVARPPYMPRLKAWAEQRYGVSAEQNWRTITPLSRAATCPTHDRLWLIGDAARVVEPFTGEGISYAMRTGLLAAEAIAQRVPEKFVRQQRRTYRPTLWINELAKAACLYPSLANALMQVGRTFPPALRVLTRKVTG